MLWVGKNIRLGNYISRWCYYTTTEFVLPHCHRANIRQYPPKSYYTRRHFFFLAKLLRHQIDVLGIRFHVLILAPYQRGSFRGL
jgi:hypothetical protein